MIYVGLFGAEISQNRTKDTLGLLTEKKNKPVIPSSYCVISPRRKSLCKVIMSSRNPTTLILPNPAPEMSAAEALQHSGNLPERSCEQDPNCAEGFWGQGGAGVSQRGGNVGNCTGATQPHQWQPLPPEETQWI